MLKACGFAQGNQQLRKTDLCLTYDHSIKAHIERMPPVATGMGATSDEHHVAYAIGLYMSLYPLHSVADSHRSGRREGEPHDDPFVVCGQIGDLLTQAQSRLQQMDRQIVEAPFHLDRPDQGGDALSVIASEYKGQGDG